MQWQRVGNSATAVILTGQYRISCKIKSPIDICYFCLVDIEKLQLHSMNQSVPAGA